MPSSVCHVINDCPACPVICRLEGVEYNREGLYAHQNNKTDKDYLLILTVKDLPSYDSVSFSKRLYE